MTVEFVTELPTQKGGGPFGQFRAEWRQPLRDNPGVWAKLPIMQRPSRPREIDGFEFAKRDGVLYGRYIGKEENDGNG